MVRIDIEYEGDLHSAARHAPSGTRLSTDAPVDNQGRGESFSPTDLVATGLGTCMSTTMGILAKKKGYPMDGAKIRVDKIMTTTGPRRIARLDTRVEMPPSTATLDPEGRSALEHAAHTCPVRLSLLEAIEVPIEFVWPEPA